MSSAVIFTGWRVLSSIVVSCSCLDCAGRAGLAGYIIGPIGGAVGLLLSQFLLSLIQIPFFFAFYKVFTVSVEMRGAPWLWVTDLSQPEHIAIRILPVVMIVSQFVMQKMTPQAAGDPNQQKM